MFGWFMESNPSASPWFYRSVFEALPRCEMDQTGGVATAGESDRIAYSNEFGTVAEEYDRSRPGHPEALFDDIISLYGCASPTVVEVGAGTGKGTVPLAQRARFVTGLEPSAEMADLARRNCAAFANVSIVVTTLEAWPIPAEPFDLVVAGQSWHWVEPGVGYSKARSLLHDLGGLAIFWTRPCFEVTPGGERLAAAYRTHAPGLMGLGPWFPGFNPSQADVRGVGPGSWAPLAVAGQIERSDHFEPPAIRSYPWNMTHASSEYVAQLRTLPEHNDLGLDRRERLFGAVEDAIATQGLDMQYETVLLFASAR